MHGLHEGQLMWKEKVENKFGKITMNAPDRGFFHLTVSVKGIREPVQLRIYVVIVQGDLVQIRDRFIEETSVRLGEKRLEALGDAVSDALYADRTLYAPHEQKDGFIFGGHFNFRQGFYRNPAIILERKSRSELEPLLTETIEREGRMVDVHYFYDPSNQMLLEGLADSWLEETWAANKLIYILRQLYTKRYDASRFAVDDQGNFYKVSTVSDPANIRLFTVHPKEFRCDIQTFTSARRVREAFTYKEALEQKARHENHKVEPFDPTLPYTVKQVTIHSERILGSPLSDYPIGTFVQTKLGAFGITTSRREGKSYEVCLESKYLPTEQRFPHNELEAIENPYQKRSNPPLVHYRIQTPRDTFDGFGYLLEERPSIYKIRPVAKYGKDPATTLQKMVIGEIRHNDWQNFVNVAKIKELHGGELDFLLIPKKHVKLLDEASTKAVEAYLSADSASTEETIFANLLALQEVHHLNLDYLLFSLVDYSAYVPMESMVKKLTELMLAHRKLGFVEACITWFEVLEAKKRVTVA